MYHLNINLRVSESCWDPHDQVLHVSHRQNLDVRFNSSIAEHILENAVENEKWSRFLAKPPASSFSLCSPFLLFFFEPSSFLSAFRFQICCSLFLWPFFLKYGFCRCSVTNPGPKRNQNSRKQLRPDHDLFLPYFSSSFPPLLCSISFLHSFLPSLLPSSLTFLFMCPSFSFPFSSPFPFPFPFPVLFFFFPFSFFLSFSISFSFFFLFLFLFLSFSCSFPFPFPFLSFSLHRSLQILTLSASSHKIRTRSDLNYIIAAYLQHTPPSPLSSSSFSSSSSSSSSSLSLS